MMPDSILCCRKFIKVEDCNGRCEVCGKEYIYRENKKKWEFLVFKNNERGMKRERKNVDEFWTETMNKTQKFRMRNSGHAWVDKAIKAPESDRMKRSAVVRCEDRKYREVVYEHLTGKEKGHMIRLLYTRLKVIEPKEGDMIGLIWNEDEWGRYIGHKILKLQPYYVEKLPPKGSAEHYIITEEE